MNNAKRFDPNQFVRIDNTVERHYSKRADAIIYGHQAVFVANNLMNLCTDKDLTEILQLYHFAMGNALTFDFIPSSNYTSFQISVSILNNTEQHYLSDSRKKIVKLLTFARKG